MAFRVFEGYDTDRAYTVAATGQQQGHPVPQVDLPAFFGDVEQPPFGNKAVEERKEDLVPVRIGAKGHRQTDRFGIRPVEIFRFVPEPNIRIHPP